MPEAESKKIVYVESPQIPLVEITYESLPKELHKIIIDPTTNKPYNGIILEGCFADLSNKTANNNFRYYDVPTYLQWVQRLKIEIFGRGVYGELEHPEGYNIDPRNISHKIIDIWWNEKEMKVFGRVMILNNTPNGIIATDIIRSGGRLAISARAAGEERKNNDGTKTGIVKLLTTYDLVWHPGFSDAILQYKNLNESQQFVQKQAQNKKGFFGVIYLDDLVKIPNLYNQYINLNESITNNCFYEWLFESENLQKKEEKKDQKIIQKNQSSDQNQIQNNLSSATEKDLKESKLAECKENFLMQMDISLIKKRQAKTVFDDSAGFLTNEPVIAN